MGDGADKFETMDYVDTGPPERVIWWDFPTLESLEAGIAQFGKPRETGTDTDGMAEPAKPETWRDRPPLL